MNKDRNLQITLKIDSMTHQDLIQLLEAARKTGTMEPDARVEDMIRYVAECIAAGWNRPGSWEGGVVRSMFGL